MPWQHSPCCPHPPTPTPLPASGASGPAAWLSPDPTPLQARGCRGVIGGRFWCAGENSPLQGFRLDKCCILIVSRKAPGSAFWVGYSVLTHVLWTRFRNSCEEPGRLSPGQSAPPCPLPSALCPSNPLPASFPGFPWVLLEQGFSVWVPWVFCTDAYSHVPHLVSEGDYRICHPKSDCKRRNAFGVKGDMFHLVQSKQNNRKTPK